MKKWMLCVILLVVLPALACDFSVDRGGEAAESTEPAPLKTALATQPPKEAPTVVLLPTPTLPAPVTVSVGADGSGDYPTLAAAVDAVPAGSTIVLDAGTYRLAEGLKINKSLRLEGAGMDETFVVGEGGKYVVHFQGPGSFAVEGITFRYEATVWGHVVVVVDGDIEFERCRFTGGVWSEEEEIGGDGLWLAGATTGRVEGCRMEGNQVHGVELGDQAAPTLEGNLCSENEQDGIAYFEEAGGLARQNECTGNGLHGIAVQGQAAPTLEANTCSENQQAGIRYSGDTGGLARQNECTANGLDGIAVQGQAAPTLEGNICSENEEAGIAYFDNGGGVARRNECSANKWGVYLEAEANPDLVDIYCHDNQEDIRDNRP